MDSAQRQASTPPGCGPATWAAPVMRRLDTFGARPRTEASCSEAMVQPLDSSSAPYRQSPRAPSANPKGHHCPDCPGNNVRLYADQLRPTVSLTQGSQEGAARPPLTPSPSPRPSPDANPQRQPTERKHAPNDAFVPGVSPL